MARPSNRRAGKFPPAVFDTAYPLFLGFYPEQIAAAGMDFFDMKNGVFSRYKPEGFYYLSPPHTQNFSALLQCNFESLGQLHFSNDERRYLLNKLLEYYALHVEGFGNIKSHEVLEEVLG